MSAANVIQMPGTVRSARKAKRPPTPATLNERMTALIDEIGGLLGNQRPADQDYVLTVLRLVADQVRNDGACDWNYNLKL